MKRILTYAELPDRLRHLALAKLHDVAMAAAREYGLVTPYAWEERVAPLCRFTTTAHLRAAASTVRSSHRERELAREKAARELFHRHRAIAAEQEPSPAQATETWETPPPK